MMASPPIPTPNGLVTPWANAAATIASTAEDGTANTKGRQDNNRGDDIRQQVPHYDAHIAASDHARRLHIRVLFGRQYGTSHQACERGDFCNAHRDHGIVQAGSENGRK